MGFAAGAAALAPRWVMAQAAPGNGSRGADARNGAATAPIRTDEAV